MRVEGPVSFKDEPARVIPGDEIKLHPFSIGDPNGQLFSWKGDLYRGIRPGHETFYRGLAERGLLGEWSKAGYLVETELTDFELPGFAAIFKHRRIEPLSLPVEWPAMMLRDAVLRTLGFALELTRHGLIIKDPHPWNTVFERTSPVYVDLTSIVPQPPGVLWAGYPNFSIFCYNPLLLMAHGYDNLARLMIDQADGVSSEVARQMTGHSLRHPFRRWERALRKVVFGLPLVRRREDHTAILLERLREKVATVRLPESRALRPESGSTANQVLGERIRRVGARSVLDLNCHSADFPLALAAAGIRVVTFSRDPAIATGIYEAGRSRSCAVLPLVMDFRNPTPGRGLGDSLSIPAEKRFGADLALVRGFWSSVSDEKPIQNGQLAEGLAGFPCPRLIVELHAAPGQLLADVATPLADALRKHYTKVSCLPGSGQNSLIECER